MNTRLKQFIAAENISQSQFADTIQVVRASVSHVLSGRNNPGYDFIKAIMNAYPNLNMEWLILGKGKMYKSSPSRLNEGGLFHDESYVPDEGIDIPAVAEYDYQPIEIAANQVSAPEFTRNEKVEKAISQRKVTKIIVFFDDGSYQEMQ